jgi:hypothetical protein
MVAGSTGLAIRLPYVACRQKAVETEGVIECSESQPQARHSPPGRHCSYCDSVQTELGVTSSEQIALTLAQANSYE